METPQIHLLGTGTAFHTDGRGSQALWLEARPDARFIVDFGPSAMRALVGAGLDYSRLDAVFFTHLHGDHIAGWPFLLLNWLFETHRTTPVQVVGPRGIQSALERLTELCYGDIAEPSRRGFEVRYRELDVEAQAGLNGTICSFDVEPMMHHESSIGFRFHTSEGQVAVSGDTGWCDGLERLARGADLLFLECSSVEEQEYPHISLEEIRDKRERLEARRIVLVHLTDAVAVALARDPIPGVDTGHDGLVLDGPYG